MYIKIKISFRLEFNIVIDHNYFAYSYNKCKTIKFNPNY